MARGVNKVILIGNLGKDPETRYFSNGDPVTNVTIATSESWKDKQTGENQERTEWHKVVFTRRLAEIAQQYLKKGSKVYVEGSLRTRSYDKDGQKHYSTEIFATEMQMLEGRGSSGSSSDAGFDHGFDQPVQAAPAPARGKPAQAAPAANFPDDDIPF